MGFGWSALDRAREFLRDLSSERLVASLLPGTCEVSAPDEDRQKAESFSREIRALPRAEREKRITLAPASFLWALSERLCRESRALCTKDTREAEAAVELALLAAGRVEGSEGWRAKVRGFVLAHLANVFRVRGDLREADRVFLSAEFLFEAGEGANPHVLEEGLLPALKASLRRAERRFDEADFLLALASEKAQGQEFKVELHVARGKLLEERGELEEAVAVLREVEGTSFPGEDGRLGLCVRHNLADYLSKLGRFEEADLLLPGVRLLSRRSEELDRVRLRWTEGRVAFGLGRSEEGLGLLSGVRGEFACREMWYDTALVTLELAASYAELGRAGEVKTLARHLVPIFREKGVHREALAALSLFRQAAENETLTVELTRLVLDYLRKARYDPELRFSV